MSRFLKFVTAGVLTTLSLLTLSGVAWSAPSAGVVRQVHMLLGAPEAVPTADDWKRVGPDAAEVLRTIANDKKELVIKRGRAASSLIYFKGDASRTTLSGLLANDKAFWLLRGKAARVLALSYGEASLSQIAPLLQHAHKRMREVAIKAVALVPSQRSAKLLTARLKLETYRPLRTLISRRIVRLNKELAR